MQSPPFRTTRPRYTIPAVEPFSNDSSAHKQQPSCLALPHRGDRHQTLFFFLVCDSMIVCLPEDSHGCNRARAVTISSYHALTLTKENGRGSSARVSIGDSGHLGDGCQPRVAPCLWEIHVLQSECMNGVVRGALSLVLCFPNIEFLRMYATELRCSMNFH